MTTMDDDKYILDKVVVNDNETKIKSKMYMNVFPFEIQCSGGQAYTHTHSWDMDNCSMFGVKCV